MTVTEQQARALTFLAAAARPTGAPRWDEAGIYANIMKVADRSLAAVVIAVMQAAEDRKAHSPGVIPTNGPHWRAPDSAPAGPEPRPRYDARKVCHACNQRDTDHVPAMGHAFLSVEAARGIPSVPVPAAIREAIGSSDLCRHGVARDHCADHDPRRQTTPTAPPPGVADDEARAGEEAL